jgi:sterol 24-C-methyltransferase
MAGHLPTTPASSTPLGTGKTRTYDSGARYRDAWKQGDDHLSKVTDEERAQRNKLAAEINDSYYDFVTDHYEHGWGKKFHFAGYQPHESWAEAHARHEHYLAYMTDIKEGMEVLDLGCGVGGPAREIAIFTGANVTGITINQMQVERGNKYSKAAGLEGQVQLQRANMIDLPFPDSSFDAVYTIEAWCCAPDAEKAVSEVYRVLKPGGKFGVYEWVNTPVYDDSNALHRTIRSGIERGSAVPYLQFASDRRKILEKVGFEVVRDEDRALSKANPVPWWYVFVSSLRIHSLH